MFSCDLRKWHQEEGPQEPRGQGQSPQLPHRSPQLPHLSQTLLPPLRITQCPTAAMINEGLCKFPRECTYHPDFLKCQHLETSRALRELLDLPVTTTPEAAHAMPWATLKKKMTDKYCPRGEIKKIEAEMWNLKLRAHRIIYIGGRCPDMILGAVKVHQNQNYAIGYFEFTTELMEEQNKSYVELTADNKRKAEDSARKQPDTSKQTRGKTPKGLSQG
ncbi:hypothetical protein Tco_1319630 [Tanacetum coccineum]